MPKKLVTMFSANSGSHVDKLTYRVRVSVNCPFTGSKTVRSRTPFCSPILTNIVGWVLLMLASNISAIQIEDGGAVSACKLMVSNVLSGSNDMILTVWSSQPTACQIAVSDSRAIVLIILTRYGVRCRPSGTSPTLSAKTVLPIAFLS